MKIVDWGFIGKVTFGKNNDFDDFYCDAVLGWCLETKNKGIQSLCKVLETYNGKLNDDTYHQTLENQYSVVGNIFQNSELLK